MMWEEPIQRRQRVLRRVVLRIQQADQGIVTDEVDLLDRGLPSLGWIGLVDTRRGNCGALIDEVGEFGDSDIDRYPTPFFTLPGQALQQVLGEDSHHDKPVLQHSRLGGFVCVLGGEEEEEAFRGCRRVGAVEGGGGDAEVGEVGRIEGGIKDVKGFGGWWGRGGGDCTKDLEGGGGGGEGLEGGAEGGEEGGEGGDDWGGHGDGVAGRDE